MPSPALDPQGHPHSEVAWIERGLTSGFRTVVFRDARARYHVAVAQLEEMGVDPNVNVNVFDPSMSDMEWRRAAREMPR